MYNNITKRIWLALLLFMLCFIGFVALLKFGLILSGDFTTLTIIFALLGTVIAYLPYISEFTLLGNTFKLEQLTMDAEQAIQNLESATADNLKIQLKLVLQVTPGMFPAGYPKDRRLENFWPLYNSIKPNYCTNEVKIQLFETVRILLKGQLECLKFALQRYDSDFDNIMTPDELSDKLKYSSIRGPNRLNEDQKKQKEEDIEDAFQDYKKLYGIYKNLSNNQ